MRDTIKSRVLMDWQLHHKGEASFSRLLDLYIHYSKLLKYNASRRYASMNLCRILKENGFKLGPKGSRAKWKHLGKEFMKQFYIAERTNEAEKNPYDKFFSKPVNKKYKYTFSLNNFYTIVDYDQVRLYLNDSELKDEEHLQEVASELAFEDAADNVYDYLRLSKVEEVK